jgi:hypothetical protein
MTKRNTKTSPTIKQEVTTTTDTTPETKEKFLLTYQNAKLFKQFIFDLPASMEVCGRVCPGCYAAKSGVRFPGTVVPSRLTKFEASKQDDFVTRIVQELKQTKKEYNYVRVHSSGEFYSQEYINKWVTIAKQLPNVTFYAFTKRIKEFDFSVISALPNFVILNSQQFGTLNYGSLDEMLKKSEETGAFICPSTIPGNKDSDDRAVCGINCAYCMSKEAQTKGILFVQH